jgi:signal transduction histidine kinase
VVGGRGVVVRCDAELTHRALTNLVRNAIEAMSESGVSGGERRVELAALRRSGRGRIEVALAVRDTGPGIAATALDRMFNPFFTTRAAGTGLGLAIVHRIMDAHGGRVEAGNNGPGLGEAGPGRVGAGGQGGPGGGSGATFSLVFPEPRARGRRPAGMPALEQDR